MHDCALGSQEGPSAPRVEHKYLTIWVQPEEGFNAAKFPRVKSINIPYVWVYMAYGKE